MIEGVITQLDIIRTAALWGKTRRSKHEWILLNQMLNTGNSIKGLGGYLQLSTNISFEGATWLLNGTAIDPSKTYKIVSPEFLFSGAEKGLEFLNEANPGIRSLKRFDAPTRYSYGRTPSDGEIFKRIGGKMRAY